MCAVEWSERAAGALPEGAVTVTLERCQGHEDWRRIVVEGLVEE